MKDVGKSLDTAMAKESNLVMEGITWRITGKEYERGRELLRDEEEGFRLCCEWLSQCQRRKTVNEKLGSSYLLKHLVESWCEKYVSNGSLIAAAVHLGIPYKTYLGSPNVNLALSGRCPFIKEWKGKQTRF